MEHGHEKGHGRDSSEGFVPLGGGKGAGATVTSVTLTSGADSVGSTGNDLILATAATLNSGDSLVGNTGMDTLSLSGSGTFNLNSLTAFSGIERIQGDSSDQVFQLKDGADLSLSTGSGHNTITTGASGTQSLQLGGGSNTVTAGAGTTLVITHGGTDVITGGSGALNVRAESGITSIIAGSGCSHIDLGWGKVTLTAGSGVDVIDLGHGSGSATVTSFTQGSDLLQVHDGHVSSYAELLTVATITSADGNTTLSLSGGPSVTLVGISSVSASDFDFTHGT